MVAYIIYCAWKMAVTKTQKKMDHNEMSCNFLTKSFDLGLGIPKSKFLGSRKRYSMDSGRRIQKRTEWNSSFRFIPFRVLVNKTKQPWPLQTGLCHQKWPTHPYPLSPVSLFSLNYFKIKGTRPAMWCLSVKRCMQTLPRYPENGPPWRKSHHYLDSMHLVYWQCNPWDKRWCQVHVPSKHVQCLFTTFLRFTSRLPILTLHWANVVLKYTTCTLLYLVPLCMPGKITYLQKHTKYLLVSSHTHCDGETDFGSYL